MHFILTLCIPISTFSCGYQQKQEQQQQQQQQELTVYKWNSFLIYKRSELVFSGWHARRNQASATAAPATDKKIYNQAQIALEEEKEMEILPTQMMNNDSCFSIVFHFIFIS